MKAIYSSATAITTTVFVLNCRPNFPELELFQKWLYYVYGYTTYNSWSSFINTSFVIIVLLQLYSSKYDCYKGAFQMVEHYFLDRIRARYVIYLMLFLGTTNIYTMRTNVNVAIIAMVKARPSHAANSTECPYSTSKHANSSFIPEGEFDWDEYSQGIVLSSFFWGYICTCIIGGVLSERFSAKWVAGIGILSTSLFSLVSPVAARTGVWYLVAVRILTGLGEGVTYSAFYAICGQWSPPFERSIATSLLHFGDTIGTAVASPVTAALIQKPLDNGWPLVFYCFGCLGVLWFLFWTILVFDSPNAHPRISKTELSIITTSLGSCDTLNDEIQNKKRSFPWIAAMTSLPVWGIIAGGSGFTWGYYTQLTLLPTYMKSVLHFDLNQSALYSILPYLARIIIGIPSGFLMDFAIKKTSFSVGTWRKIAYIISSVIPGCLTLSIPFIGCDKWTALAVLTVSSGIGSFQTSASLASSFDIAPNFAGTLYGIINTPQTLTGILAPYVAGYITNGNSNVESWSTVFYLAAGFNFAGTILYVSLLGDGKPLKWNFQ